MALSISITWTLFNLYRLHFNIISVYWLDCQVNGLLFDQVTSQNWQCDAWTFILAQGGNIAQKVWKKTTWFRILKQTTALQNTDLGDGWSRRTASSKLCNSTPLLRFSNGGGTNRSTESIDKTKVSVSGETIPPLRLWAKRLLRGALQEFDVLLHNPVFRDWNM